MLLIIIILVLVFGVGGGYWGNRQWGPGGGLGVVGLILVILLICWLAGLVRL
jgi:hypothetical protein